MQHNKLLALYGLKWNPFFGNIPCEGLVTTDQIDRFAWKIENLVLDGGFAAITGDPGNGKSVALRLVFDRFAAIRDLSVGVLSRPQSNIGDFYRELGHLFGVELKNSNRYGGYSSLREKWQSHLKSTQFRPVLFIDEAQEMPSITLNELRLLTSTKFDSHIILTVILSGDNRLAERLRQPDLAPLDSRIRTRMLMKAKTSAEMRNFLQTLIESAGNPTLMSDGLVKTLAEHSTGNYRVMTTMAHELLVEGIMREAKQLDEDLFFDVYKSQSKSGKRTAKNSKN